jgi:LemA protein
LINYLITAIVLIILWVVISYNFFVRDRNRIQEAWSGIDVQLKRRHNLIPNLVETVKGYSSHEKRLLEDITEKRASSVNTEIIKDKAVVETDISGLLKNLIVVAENYPDLKASKNFLDFQKQLIEIEDQLQFARRYYNGTVRNYNIRVESFPGNIIAGIFKFQPKDFFEISLATERETPEVKL